MSVSLSSKSHDDYEFIIPPWEYRGADFDPRPDAVVEEVATFRHRLLLKVKQNYLFFREAEADPTQIFAVPQALASTSKEAETLKAKPEMLSEIYQAAVAKHNVAKFYISHREIASDLANCLTFMRANGTGVCREFWDDDGVPFQPQSRMLPRGFEFYDNVLIEEILQECWEREILPALQIREVPDHLIQAEPFHWVCGDEQNLTQLVTWLAQGFVEEWDQQRITYTYECASPFQNKGRLSFEFSDRGPGLDPEIPANLRSIIALFLQENTAVGWEWRRYNNLRTRGWCDVEPISFWRRIPRCTAHESLEAKLNLRNWLGGKLPEAEIQRLLS